MKLFENLGFAWDRKFTSEATPESVSRAVEFNENMVRFFLDKDATEMMEFLVECQPGNSSEQEPDNAPSF